jgi:hypothetical protein
MCPLPWSLVPAPCSLFPVPCSLFPVPCPLSPVPCPLSPLQQCIECPTPRQDNPIRAGHHREGRQQARHDPGAARQRKQCGQDECGKEGRFHPAPTDAIEQKRTTDRQQHRRHQRNTAYTMFARLVIISFTPAACAPRYQVIHQS